MFELDEVDVERIVKKNISVQHAEKLLLAFTSEDVKAEEFEEIGEDLSAEPKVLSKQFVPHSDGSGEVQPHHWQYVKAEIYSMICTDSTAAKTIWDEVKKGFEALVKAFVTVLAVKSQMGIAVLTSLVTVALLMVYKMSTKVWCNLQQPEVAPASS